METKIIRHLTGEASRQESKTVLEWQKDNPEEFEKWEATYSKPLFQELEFIRKSKLKDSKSFSIRKEFGIAAAILLLLGIGWLFVPNPSCPKDTAIEIVNTEKQNLTIILPDSSSVTINPKSSLRYEKNFTREIFLSGTALLKIYKDKTHPFIVNSQFSKIRVLGTEFMVQNFENKQNIILKEGKVEVNSLNQKQTLQSYGEMLTITKSNEFSPVKTVNCSLYFSWQKEKLSFQQASVKEVVEYLEDCYSIDVKMLDNRAWQTKLIGSAPKGKPELIVEAIAKIINKEIEKKNNKYILK
jgi:ferric-dicitrate binding protein FerR (iron transport regulator)